MAGIVVVICLITTFGLIEVAASDFGKGDPWGVVALVIVAVPAALLGIGATRLARAPLSPVIKCIIWCSTGIVAVHLAASFIEDDVVKTALTTSALIGVGHVALIVVAWTFTRRKHNATFGDLRLNIPRPPLRALVKGIAIWIAALVLVGAWGWLIEAVDSPEFLVPPDNVTTLLDELGGIWPLAILAASVAAPVAEELFFRSFLLAGLMKRFGPQIATVLSSALFAVSHLAPGIGTGILIPVFVLGVALALIYLWTRSVWICIIVHGTHNTVTLFAASALDQPFAG